MQFPSTNIQNNNKFHAKQDNYTHYILAGTSFLCYAMLHILPLFSFYLQFYPTSPLTTPPDRDSLLTVMWTSWLPGRVHTNPRSRSFSCSSFKDVLTLSSQGQHDTEPCPASPRSPTIFHRVALPASSYPRDNTFQRATSKPQTQPVKSIVVYFTSLRVVRRTFDDCRLVLSILRCLGVPIDERDLSMDARYHKF